MNLDKKHSEIPDPPLDRREAPRTLTVDFVWYKVLDTDGDLEKSEEGIFKMRDISHTGLGLYVTKPLPVGTLVFIEICSRMLRLSAVGEVVNIRETKQGYFRIGIRFRVMPPNDRLALMTFWKKNDKS
jgi:c-di-GMP-binding flagellar brake protein YcgR